MILPQELTKFINVQWKISVIDIFLIYYTMNDEITSTKVVEP
jgi:hypothetical protein